MAEKTPTQRTLKIVFAEINDGEYNAIANAMWAIVAAANADGTVFPDRQADLGALNAVWVDYSDSEWGYDPDDDQGAPPPG